ncbi:MAG: carboxylating nicotinate-nucleotide diphosphorylase [Thermoplasmata archaeon]
MLRRDRPRGGAAGSVRALARRVLAEDRIARDRTTRALFPRPVPAKARIIAQATGVLSGTVVARAMLRAAGVRVLSARADGSRVRRGEVVLALRGDARRILGVERSVLNVLMHASGVASATAKAVAATRGSAPRLEVWGTRKTLPGLRDLEKAAIVHGGGRPHRRNLSESLLIKNNHLALLPLAEAVRRARARARRGEAVEVEVRSAAEALRAARAGARRILIDNASPPRARAIVRALEVEGLRRGRWVELSGGITPATVGAYRRVGANAVSLGALTHSAPALPFHLELVPARLSPRHD